MDSNHKNELDEEEDNSMEQQTIIYAYNHDPQHPEETETILLSKTQSKSTTKRYKGVWRKNGRWIARIRNPITNSRIFLGKFSSNEDALSAYFAKKIEFESQIRAEKCNNSAMIDNHGFLLGDFSRLDDDLRICEEGITQFSN